MVLKQSTPMTWYLGHTYAYAGNYPMTNRILLELGAEIVIGTVAIFRLVTCAHEPPPSSQLSCKTFFLLSKTTYRPCFRDITLSWHLDNSWTVARSFHATSIRAGNGRSMDSSLQGTYFGSNNCSGILEDVGKSSQNPLQYCTKTGSSRWCVPHE